MPPTDDSDDYDHDHEPGISLDAVGGWRSVTCPCCGEPVELHLDGESTGSWVEDCPVCCQPWQVTVTRDHDGIPSLRVEPS